MPVTVNYEFSRDGFESAVEEAKGFIRDGDIYQVNIAHRIRVEGLLNPLGLYARLRAINPSPHMGYADLGDLKIVCNSPERLVYLGGGFCETRPIAGTRPRGQTSYEDEFMFRDLTTNEKEIAEHTMMVDMERNDLGRISVPGSVYVDEMMSVEKYSHVMHLVSNIRGKPIRSLSIKEMISAMMPGGTISGVPKSRAMEIIDMLEPVPRGPYTGSLGYISSHVDMNILIRTLIFTGARAYLYVGSGIVYDSIPEKEFDETIYKAGAVLSLLSGSRKPAGSCGVIVRGEWRPPSSKRRFTRRKVLLVDNYDSFTYNLAQYISSAGAKVDVVLRDRIPSDLNRYTHIVISPGPGRPESAGMCIDLLRQEEAIPILGVCLGHQVIALASGGKVEKGPPVHGKVSRIRIVKRSPIFSGLPEVFDAGRYHSLVVNPSSVPGELNVDAISDGGIIMSLSHRRRKVYGIQFHPESVLTPRGMRIIENFLEVRP
jgi:anthranilate synthase/aminodeoxychorismate synthase-like glutamine amidotransferase